MSVKHISELSVVCISHFSCYVQCHCVFRYFTEMYRCLYDVLKDKCNSTAAVIYTDYNVRVTRRWLETIHCYISK